MTTPFYITIGLLGLLTATVSSQAIRPAGRLQTPATATPQAARPAARAGEALIKGSALDMNNTPMAKAPVRLRNLLSNQIEQSSYANQAGEFTFVARPEIPYVVEIADQAGRIIAVSDVITAQSGDVAGTLVTVPTRLASLAGIFSDTAGSVLSAAAGIGITAISPGIPRVSPER